MRKSQKGIVIFQSFFLSPYSVIPLLPGSSRLSAAEKMCHAVNILVWRGDVVVASRGGRLWRSLSLSLSCASLLVLLD